jgi:hypothetical protein
MKWGRSMCVRECRIYHVLLSGISRLGLSLAALRLPGRRKPAYQDFLTLWKDADPDIPIFIAAKAEYAQLK